MLYSFRYSGDSLPPPQLPPPLKNWLGMDKRATSTCFSVKTNSCSKNTKDTKEKSKGFQTNVKDSPSSCTKKQCTNQKTVYAKMGAYVGKCILLLYFIICINFFIIFVWTFLTYPHMPYIKLMLSKFLIQMKHWNQGL